MDPELAQQVDDAVDRMAVDHLTRTVEALLVEVRNGHDTRLIRDRFARLSFFALRHLRHRLEYLLDDPYGFGDELPLVLKVEVPTICADLGLSLEALIDSAKATAFERERLRGLIATLPEPEAANG